MDARTDFLTAPTPSPRGNEGSAGTSTGEISPSGAQFAGVLNGHMLKLERQALASSPPQAADLQVLRLGNKLNVITTDAPLPDVASLADFARAQGLGESAVSALFGTPVQTLTDLSQGLRVTNGLPPVLALATDKLVDSGNPQAAMALAQASAKDLLEAGLSQDGISVIAGQNWLSLRAQSAAAAAITISAEALARPALGAKLAVAAQTMAAGAQEKDPVLDTTTAIAGAAPDSNGLQAPNVLPWDTQAQLNALLASQSALHISTQPDADRALLAARPPQPAGQDGAKALETTLAIDPASVLAAALQAGLGMVPVQEAGGPNALAVTVTNLSIEKSGTAKLADPVGTGAAIVAAAGALIQLSAPASAASIEDSAEVPAEPPADLQIRLVPPDQAITQRLAQMAGKSKPIDWSALLAGQKVSDTLAGLAHSPAPALSDAQANLVVQMQANGQLPASTDEGRNALLAKLQAQAASTRATPAGFSAQTGSQIPTSTVTAPPIAPAPQIATPSAGAADSLPTDNKALASQNTLTLQATGAGALLAPARPSSLWESVRIEVPSGLVLEALQEHQDQKSDAEPTLPTSVSAAAGPGSSQAHSPAADKAQVATPQAMAEQRAAQYQQVADQLGEAMAKRLMAQIERGQWKMQLRMQPAALGRIDVELDMHAKGLDATFTSDNAMTRELMAQGSARLRDTLTQTGTTVASVVVNGDSGRQSGGNSTPGQKPKGEQNANNKKGLSPALVQTAAMPPAAQGDGLNVLA